MQYHLTVGPSFRYDNHFPLINLDSLFIFAEQIFTGRKKGTFLAGASYEHKKIEKAAMFCHINSVPTTQQSRLINGDIKNNIREHVHGVVMATRIPNYPVLHTLPCSFMPSGMMDTWGKKKIDIFLIFCHS